MDNEKTPKNAEKYYCKNCNFRCSKKSDYNRHLSTLKHRRITMDNEKTPKNAAAFNGFVCGCGKTYVYSSGLSKHRKFCDILWKSSLSNDMEPKIDATMVRELINQNRELQQQLLSLTLPNKSDIRTINNTTNNNNTQNFNISVFLNEYCKDAINFSDFINNIQVSHEDLQNNAQLGFVGGISKIITDNLKQLTLHERPIHCTDAKRETMYIKDENTWQKDKSFIQEKLNRAIQEVSRKSVSSLMQWKQTNPDYADMDSDFSNLCLIMQQQSIAGMNREKYYPKVIHRIAECVPCKDV